MSEKILVIHQGALGDVILSFPAVLSLRQEKNACICLLCKAQVGKIACQLRVVDACFPVESARFCTLFSEDMSHDMKDFINQYETIVSIGYSDVGDHIRQNHRGQTCQITPRPPAEEETHVAVHIMRQLQDKGLLENISDCGTGSAECGMESNNRGDVFKPTGAMWESNPLWAHNSALRIPHSASRPQVLSSSQHTNEQTKCFQGMNLVLIHPGAGSKRKRWPLEKFVEVGAAIRKMNSCDIIYLIGPAESDLLPLVKNQGGGRFQIRQVEDLAQVLAFMKAANYFIGNDSGLTHLSAFMGVPTVAIFGPSSPNRWAPIGPATKVLRGKVDCAACFEVEKRNCEVPQCLNGVSVDMVVDAVKELA